VYAAYGGNNQSVTLRNRGCNTAETAPDRHSASRRRFEAAGMMVVVVSDKLGASYLAGQFKDWY
jgi:hypothetical protein